LNIQKFKNNGIEYLRLVESSYNRELKKQRVKVIKNLGAFSRFDDGEPDYLYRLRRSFKEGSPLIEELLPFVDGKRQGDGDQTVTLSFTEGGADCIGNPKSFAPLILNHVFKSIGLTEFLTLHKSRSKIEYDLLGLVKLMCYGRILNPASKLSTFGQKEDYYEDICQTKNQSAVYRALDVLYEKRPQLLRKINAAITKSIGRNTDLVFYDVTNFYFEVEQADADREVDGHTVKGLRQRGVSKENRKTPIVQMGLFMDSNGIPISFETFSGNALDQTTLRPAMKRTVDSFELARFVLVSDRGMMSGPNIAHVLQSGNGYIISKSIKKTGKAEREWILEEEGYVHVSKDYRYKSRIVSRSITDEAGNKQTIKQKVVVYWSRKFYEREAAEHQSFLEFVEAFRQNPSNFRVNKSQQGYLKKFMKKEFMNNLTGEVISGDNLIGFVDEDKLSKHTEFYGYYQIVSSELKMTELEIIDKYHGLTQIENQFRVMKNSLDTRPMYVSTDSRIEAHLTVCLIALIMIRVIQFMVKKNPAVSKEEKLNWFEGMSAERIQNALNKFQVEELTDGYYRFNSIRDKDLSLLMSSFGFKPEAKLYTTGQLRQLGKQLVRIE